MESTTRPNNISFIVQFKEINTYGLNLGIGFELYL